MRVVEGGFEVSYKATINPLVQVIVQESEPRAKDGNRPLLRLETLAGGDAEDVVKSSDTTVSSPVKNNLYFTPATREDASLPFFMCY